mgnify:CR=1 FL=1
MGRTIVEKILAERTGRTDLKPGDCVMAEVDLAVGTDITAPMAIQEFISAGQHEVHDPSRIALVPDHYSPAQERFDTGSCQSMREFAAEHEIENFFDIGRIGIAHNLLIERGLVLPGDVVIGADPHTCAYGAMGALGTGVGSSDLAGAMLTGRCWFHISDTIRIILRGELQPWVTAKDLGLFLMQQLGVGGARYCVIEFHGEAIESLNQEDRFTLCNMAVEVGVKAAIIPPDKKTREYLAKKGGRKPKFYKSDKSANYIATLEYDATRIKPMVACLNTRANVRELEEAGKPYIDQVFIGSCSNGWLDDLRTASEVLELSGRKISSHTRMIVVPATPEIYRRALHEDILQVFADAGAAISTPSYGPGFGGLLGILGQRERCVSTSSHYIAGYSENYHPEAEIFVSNPAVAAASAVLGHLGSPEEI